ncbi:ABC transporter ATP-binding protein [Peptoniphilus sp. BV3AC2]|uniref:ABC transporter ATP-binding protein n=1 Tax=Peptoniphilus sp. BV3AC2 TaxID=1111133 RepID=UPI0003B91ACC|nr:ABC transporter ATP-binding protein [Peptoniphilus sp. BV3AC2]ERT62661.1 ABC transporter, ATP-binding protein [Peptoniphilus sp. BV3AC2]
MSIELKNIRKCYEKDVAVIDDFNLSIEDGDFVVFLGPSGCGKSTLLRIIAGLIDIDGGSIFMDGENITNSLPKDRNMAFVFQNYALYPHMTVSENITVSLKLKKVPKEKIESKLKEIAELLSIEDLLNRYPRELSGGQQQRVALARAIIRSPKAYLMDEPLSNLDAKLRQKMRFEIMKLYEKLKITTIYVTHDQVEAMTMATRVVLLNKGKIIQSGPPQELFDAPINTFVANFIGNGMNFFEGEIRDGELHFFDFKIPFKSKENLKVQVGIRPEHINLDSGNKYEVKYCENLGAESILHFEEGKDNFTVRTFLKDDINNGDRFDISFDREKIHIFKEDGTRYEEE